MFPLLLLLLSLQSLNQPAAAENEGHLLTVKEGIAEDPTPATNGTSDDYYEESPDNEQTNTNSQWLYEFIEETDECDPNPCYNNGVCENDGDGDFKCSCPRPFKGKRCQTFINVCKNVKCGRGECVITNEEPFYECKCIAPFQPPNCRRPSACNPSPCRNGGTCVKGRTRAKFHCKCPENYSGKFCQVGPDDCYEGDGESYRGFVSETVSGHECLPWNSHLITFSAADDDDNNDDNEVQQEDDGIGEHNYCRNPDGESQPWCFIRFNNSLLWDDCNVTHCPEPVLTPTEPTTNKEEEHVTITTPAPENEFTVCGKPWPSRITPRIFGGRKSKPGTHPWQASVQRRPRNSTHPFIHDCGGIVLNSCWILTAAHCIHKTYEMQVVLGGVDLDKHEAADQTLAVEKYIVHDNYTEIDDVQYNDIDPATEAENKGLLLDLISDIAEGIIAAVNGTDSEYDEESYGDTYELNVDWLFGLFDEIDECDPNPCYNNGTCKNDGQGDFKCSCPFPFKGKRCQDVINVCKNVKCGRGECVLIENEPFYECKCIAPFQPPNCRRPSACNPSPCLNGGKCVKGRTRAKFHCRCPENYSGKFCQVGPNDCYEGDGASYRGFVSETVTGQECLPWNSYLIMQFGPFADDDDDVEDDGIGPHNYCRNPDGESQPWCFIRHKNKLRWNDCDVTRCPEPVSSTVLTTVEEAKPTAKVEFSECGKPWPSRITPRIFGGRKSMPGAHPWQVSLQIRLKNTTDGFKHYCGGILLNSCWVLTAAHCIDNTVEMQVGLGGVDLEKQESADQTVAVEDYIMHENYTETDEAIHNDIALLKLKAMSEDGLCARETRFVKAACPPLALFLMGSNALYQAMESLRKMRVVPVSCWTQKFS
ncbi:hypothetical protein AMELA_G00112910 [Ameiurus melas]|uniref:trypsin n=1 Tax=Ameiurus melas TaxID=219545 RepID=A0A7J6ASE4_AMEME|nr:hypothetical protein AMELA_G00112910 [Ameiurus melas]